MNAKQWFVVILASAALFLAARRYTNNEENRCHAMQCSKGKTPQMMAIGPNTRGCVCEDLPRP